MTVLAGDSAPSLEGLEAVDHQGLNPGGGQPLVRTD